MDRLGTALNDPTAVTSAMMMGGEVAGLEYESVKMSYVYGAQVSGGFGFQVVQRLLARRPSLPIRGAGDPTTNPPINPPTDPATKPATNSTAYTNSTTDPRAHSHASS